MVPLTLDGEAARQISRPAEGVGLGPFLRGDRRERVSANLSVCLLVCLAIRQLVLLSV